jgi:hypothetical protein
MLIKFLKNEFFQQNWKSIFFKVSHLNLGSDSNEIIFIHKTLNFKSYKAVMLAMLVPS